MQPAPGTALLQAVGRLRCRQFTVPLDNLSGGSFLPIAVHQSESRRPAQWGNCPGRRQPRLFPAQEPGISRQQNLLSGQSHPLMPPEGKEGKTALLKIPSHAAGQFIVPIQVDDEVKFAAQQHSVGHNYSLLRLFDRLGGQFEDYRLPRPVVGDKIAAEGAFEIGFDQLRYRTAEQTDNYRVLPPTPGRHCIQVVVRRSPGIAVKGMAYQQREQRACRISSKVGRGD